MKEWKEFVGGLSLLLLIVVFPLSVWTNFRYKENVSMTVRQLTENGVIDSQKVSEYEKEDAHFSVTNTLLSKNYAWTNMGIPISVVAGLIIVVLLIPNRPK